MPRTKLVGVSSQNLFTLGHIKVFVIGIDEVCIVTYKLGNGERLKNMHGEAMHARFNSINEHGGPGGRAVDL